MNLYSFAGGNPINRIDPEGTDVWAWFDNLFHVTQPHISDVQNLQMRSAMAALDNDGNKAAAAAQTNAYWNKELKRRQGNQHKLDMALTVATLPIDADISLAKLATKFASLRAISTEFSINGFKSFNAFKEVYGNAGAGNAWHHIVEKYQESKFGAGNINNPMNIVHMSAADHNIISAIYSSVRPRLTQGSNLTVRQWPR